MSKNTKIIGAVTVIGLGFMLLLMLGGMMMRARTGMIYSSRMAARTAQSMPAPESADSAAPETVDPKYFHPEIGRFGFDHGFAGPGSRSMTPFSFIGGLFRFAALGLLAFLFLGLIRKRHHGRQHPAGSGGARVADEVEDEIRVGDEIGHAPEPGADDLPHSDEMTVDDLLQAMKRLGIKKLEL